MIRWFFCKNLITRLTICPILVLCSIHHVILIKIQFLAVLSVSFKYFKKCWLVVTYNKIVWMVSIIPVETRCSKLTRKIIMQAETLAYLGCCVLWLQFCSLCFLVIVYSCHILFEIFILHFSYFYGYKLKMSKSW